jgi:hypothetical protein
MLQHNDSKVAVTAYDKLLLRNHIPRQFWKYFVKEPTFVDCNIERKIEGRKKPQVLYGADAEAQSKYWLQLLHLIYAWNPSGPGSPDEHFCLFCCEDLKKAQFMLFTCAQFMLSKMYKQDRASYTMDVKRSYEFSKLFEIEEAQDAPNVVLIPSVISEFTPSQVGAFTELFSSSYRIFAATSLTPQKFFERFNYVPAYVFYIDEVRLALAAELIKVV